MIEFFFICVSFLIIILSGTVRDKNEKILLVGTLIVSHSISLINAKWFRTIGADADALDFHNRAIESLHTGEIKYFLWQDFYTNLLAGFYFFSDSRSILTGQSLSILFLLFSLLIFLKLFDLMEIGKYKNVSLFCVAFLPSSLLICSITLREVFEIFFFIFSVYCFTRYYKNKKFCLFFISILSAFMMGLFHQGLMIFAVILAGLFILYGLIFHRTVFILQKRWMILLCSITVFVSIFFIQVDKNRKCNLIESLLIGKGFDYAEKLRKGHIDYNMAIQANATYGVTIDRKSKTTFILSIGNILFHYFTAPFPWEISDFKGFYAFLENLWRIVLICFSIKFFVDSKSSRPLTGLLLGAYFCLSFIWAMGTVNYGTAVRHHLVGYWILVLLGTPALMESLSIFNKKLHEKKYG